MLKKKTKIKAVIFDLDGVLVDSEPIESAALEIVLKEYGKTPKYNNEGLIHTVGLTEGVYEKLIDEYALDVELDELKEKKRKFFRMLVQKHLLAIPGALQFIRMLKNQGLKTAIASNRLKELVFVMIKKVKAEHLFDVIIGYSEGIKHKPHPDIYLMTANELHINPSRCIAIEDSETGIFAAKGAGMKVIAITSSYTRSHDFSKADKIVKSFSEISLDLIYNL